ncbi:MAG: phage holin family protein [Candidatus Nanoarchaeia archaeon]|jgi:toxin secretion/phage lysis holin|nr:phage holin family protein [Candidatus Nanoarchaeia archaeon]
MENKIKIVFALLGSFICWFLGGVDGFLYTLIAFIIVDYISGVMVAITFSKANSKIGFKGIFKKVFMLLLVGIASLVDEYFINTGGAVRGLVICFYIGNEGISIIENANKLDLPIPDKLKEIFKNINKNNEVK